MENSTFQFNWNADDLKKYLSDFNTLSDSIQQQSVKNDITSVLKVMLATEEIKDIRQNREERKSYASHIFIMICIYLILVFTLLFFSGFGFWGFYLSDSIILSLIGTTLINVLGVFIIVVNYLFPKKR